MFLILFSHAAVFYFFYICHDSYIFFHFPAGTHAKRETAQFLIKPKNREKPMKEKCKGERMEQTREQKD